MLNKLKYFFIIISLGVVSVSGQNGMNGIDSAKVRYFQGQYQYTRGYLEQLRSEETRIKAQLFDINDSLMVQYQIIEEKKRNKK